MTLLGIIASSKLGFPTSPVAGYKAWYDAADTATISLSGSAVTQWNDKSANAYNLTQGTSARRPQSGVNTMNSKNVITFDGNDVLLAATASNWTFMNNSTGATVFCVALFNDSVDPQYIMSTGGASGVNVGFLMDRTDTDELDVRVIRGVAGNNTSTLTSGALTDATAKYWSVVMDNANATASARLRFRLNGGSELTGNVLTNAASSSNPLQPLYVGSYDTSGSYGTQGRIAEILIYSGILSDTDIALNNLYLANKWGI
jgi:hypothetical protein